MDMESDYSVHSSFSNGFARTQQVFGLCDKAHYHHQLSSWSNAPLQIWPESLQANAFDKTYQTEPPPPVTSKIYYIRRCPCDIQIDMNYSVHSNTAVYGLCDKAHYHDVVTEGPNAPSRPLPESLPSNAFKVTYRTGGAPINAKFFYINKCPMDLRSSMIGDTSSHNLSSTPLNGSGSGSCDQDNVIPKAMLDAFEKKLFNSIQKKQDEMLNNFKKETDTIIKNFKLLFNNLNWEVTSMSNTVASNCAQLKKFGEQIEELEYKIQEIVPEPTSSDSDGSSSSEESEDILQEIDAIKQSDRTLMDYRPLTGQCWETSKPITFEVTICDTTLQAIYDPRVAKSVMSDDILFSDDETEELDYDKVFYVPWWFPKLQTIRDEGTVDVLINTYYSHTLKVAFNPLWNKTVVLGFNFGQKFIENVNEDSGIISLCDDAGSSYDLNFEYYYN